MKRSTLLTYVALAIAACKTATPDEVFSFAATQPGSGGSSAQAGRASGGKSSGGDNATGGLPPVVVDGGDTGMPVGDGGAGGETSPPLPDDTCGPAPISMSPFSRVALREAAGECAMWHYCRAEATARELDVAVQAHRDAASDATLERARSAWQVAMERWSAAELFQFGPAGSKAESAGKDPVHGQGIRDTIYAWPVVARCRVEDQVILRGYETSWSPVLISARGLFALDYLLFYGGSDTACSPNSSTAKSWAMLDAAAIESAKRDYAAALGGDILGRIGELRSAWSPDGGNFRQTLIDATGYEGEQQALNVIAWSLLYVEREVKDWKVGVPAGLTLTHPVTVAEASFSRTGTPAIRANLRGFRALFQGCGEQGEGLGFDDWLTDVGQGELANDMVAALDTAQSAVDAFPPIEQASPSELNALYQSLRGLTSLLKSDFFGPGSTLNLKLPAGVASDTD